MEGVAQWGGVKQQVHTQSRGSVAKPPVGCRSRVPGHGSENKVSCLRLLKLKAL